MSDPSANKLERQLGLKDVFAVATGATLSAGLFLLPGLVAQDAGPAIVLCYILAALLIIPPMLCIVELSTAMPRAGGAYYYLERSLGPLFGTIGGLGTWLALSLKTAFALVGIGEYLALFVDLEPWMMKSIASALAVAFGVLNALGSHKTGGVQRLLVGALLVILTAFVLWSTPSFEPGHFQGFFDAGWETILATTGVVYISYAGVTKVTSIGGEVKNPERNMSLGMILSLVVAILVYGLCTAVLVGVLPMDALQGTKTPMSDAAMIFGGKTGQIVLAAAAFLAFFSVANAGILSSSRYPLAMARDQLVPGSLSRVSGHGAPLPAIILTVALIVAVIFGFDALKIAKLASAFQLIMFALLCLAVIVMRESGLDSYDPGYRVPWYPWLPLFGATSPFVLVYLMGRGPTLFSMGMIVLSIFWFFGYARNRVSRRGAIFHVFARLGEQRHEELDVELREILKEKGLRDADPFDEIVFDSIVLDERQVANFDGLIQLAAKRLSRALDQPEEVFVEGFTEGTRVGATPVAKGSALPHMHLAELETPMMVLARVKDGVAIGFDEDTEAIGPREIVRSVFFLVSPKEDPSQHLRMLAQLATRIDEPEFQNDWMAAKGELQIRELFLREDRYLSVRLTRHSAFAPWLGQAVANLDLPEGAQVTLVRRRGKTLAGEHDLYLQAGDRVVLTGEPAAIHLLREQLEKA